MRGTRLDMVVIPFALEMFLPQSNGRLESTQRRRIILLRSVDTHALVFGLLEESRHHGFHKNVREMDPKGLSAVYPRNDVIVALAGRSIQHVV
jgi:hypothetical protein